MFVRIFLLMTFASARGLYPSDGVANGQQHHQQPQPQEQAFHPQGKSVARSEAPAAPSLAPQWGFIPLIAGNGFGFGIPPVIQVHHIVQVQSPNQRCFPSPPNPTNSPSGGGGLDSRFGETNQTASNQPSPCVWAIVSCCSPGNANIRYACFELLGCQGAFWDLSPCEPRVVQAAANSALMFYMSASPPKNESNVIDFEAPESSLL